MKTLAQFLRMNKKLKHKDLFKYWTQSKSKHTNIKSEYFQNKNHCSLGNNPEERSSHILRRGRQKSRTLEIMSWGCTDILVFN
jgi:hypothetical protein